MKKEYIKPTALVFVCQTNAMLMTSTSDSLDNLLVDDNVNIIPDSDPVDEFFSHDDDFDFGSDDDFDFE